MRRLKEKLQELSHRKISSRAAAPLVVVVLAICAYFLFHAAVDKPIYPGLNAGKPTGESPGQGTMNMPSDMKFPAGAAPPPGAPLPQSSSRKP